MKEEKNGGSTDSVVFLLGDQEDSGCDLHLLLVSFALLLELIQLPNIAFVFHLRLEELVVEVPRLTHI